MATLITLAGQDNLTWIVVLIGHLNHMWPVIIVKIRVTPKTTVFAPNIKLYETSKCKNSQWLPNKARAENAGPHMPKNRDSSVWRRYGQWFSLDWKNHNQIEELYRPITSQNVSAQVKFDMMQRAAATFPKVNMGCRRKRVPSLLHCSSQVTLICQSYFEREIFSHIVPSSQERLRHISCSNWQQPIM